MTGKLPEFQGEKVFQWTETGLTGRFDSAADEARVVLPRVAPLATVGWHVAHGVVFFCVPGVRAESVPPVPDVGEPCREISGVAAPSVAAVVAVRQVAVLADVQGVLVVLAPCSMLAHWLHAKVLAFRYHVLGVAAAVRAQLRDAKLVRPGGQASGVAASAQLLREHGLVPAQRIASTCVTHIIVSSTKHAHEA